MRPVTVLRPVPTRGDRATPIELLPGCWYRDPAHRPRVGWCPSTCHGPVTHAERLGNGDEHAYCETHAQWRRRTIRLPTLVRRLQPGVQPDGEAPT